MSEGIKLSGGVICDYCAWKYPQYFHAIPSELSLVKYPVGKFVGIVRGECLAKTSGRKVRITMQEYKSLRAAVMVMICATSHC